MKLLLSSGISSLAFSFSETLLPQSYPVGTCRQDFQKPRNVGTFKKQSALQMPVRPISVEHRRIKLYERLCFSDGLNRCGDVDAPGDKAAMN